MKHKKLIQTLALLGALTTAANSHSVEMNGIEFSGSGFMTLGIGKMLGGTRNNVSDYDCPCFISDYAQAGVYDGRSGLQWKPDSKLGVQGTASFDNRRFSLTAQAVSRGARDGSVNLEWLYGSYKLNDKITLQAGRKRLPMFYYSDVQDIGVALPWTHLPPGPYGWEAVNYNGVNLAYQDQWNDWSATANLLAGNESKKDSGYWKIYNGRQSRSNIKWDNIVGGDFTISKGWLETRAVYIQSNTEQNYASDIWDSGNQTYVAAPDSPIYPPAKQQIYGLTINADYQNWLLRTEFIYINHPGLGYRDYAQLAGVGYHHGKWQPMVTWSRYKGTSVNSGLLEGAAPGTPNMQQTLSLTLRYDLSTSSTLKVQFDNQTDHSDPAYTPNFGDSRLLTFSYDMVF